MDDHTRRMVLYGDYSGLINTATEEQKIKAGVYENPFNTFFNTVRLDCLTTEAYRQRLAKQCCDDICEHYSDKLRETRQKIATLNHFLMMENKSKEELYQAIKQERLKNPKNSIQMPILKINYNRCSFNIASAEKDLSQLVKDEQEYAIAIKIYTYVPPLDPYIAKRINDLDRYRTKSSKQVERAKQKMETHYDQSRSEQNGLLSDRVMYTENSPQELGMDTIAENPFDLLMRELEEEEYMKTPGKAGGEEMNLLNVKNYNSGHAPVLEHDIYDMEKQKDMV